jgi:hypothetical protein
MSLRDAAARRDFCGLTFSLRVRNVPAPRRRSDLACPYSATTSFSMFGLRPGFNPWPTTLGGTFYAAIRFDLSLIGHYVPIRPLRADIQFPSSKRTGAEKTIRFGLSLFGHYFVLDVRALRPGLTLGPQRSVERFTRRSDLTCP